MIQRLDQLFLTSGMVILILVGKLSGILPVSRSSRAPSDRPGFLSPSSSRPSEGTGPTQPRAPANQDPDRPLLEQARQVLGMVNPPPKTEQQTPLVELGHRLFWDARLSANGQISCGSCHQGQDWGSDSAPFSLDARGKPTKRHSQTVFNATLQPRLRWVADRTSAAEQAEKSLTGSMGFASPEQLLPLLRKFDYAVKFQEAFPQAESPLTVKNYGLAIAAYEDTLRTSAALDRFLAGNLQALTSPQQEGLKLFLELGCADCHSGRLLGGEDLATFGVHYEYWTLTGSEQRDAGLFETSGKETDRYSFRIPMLRNIAKTAPYFHDGSVPELTRAVQIMAKLQLDLDLSESQTSALVAFLDSLTGEVPENYFDPFSTDPATRSDLPPAEDWNLEFYGTMREAIGMGQHQGRVVLGQIADQPHFYGVGALANLQGEITLFDSQLFVSTVNPAGRPITLTPEDAATMQGTLLIGARVEEWIDVPVERSIRPADVDRFLGELAQRYQIDINDSHPAFPFLIQGVLEDVHLHIIRGACPVHSRRNKVVLAEEERPFEWHQRQLNGRVVGVYAVNQAGKLTHPGTNIHAHLIFHTEDGSTVTGHLEQFGIEAGSTVRLPKGRRRSD
jgi:cytochrome c peroxidase